MSKPIITHDCFASFCFVLLRSSQRRLQLLATFGLLLITTKCKLFSETCPKLQNIAGEAYIDVGKVLIEASEIEGKTFIKNRFGTTRFYQATPKTNGPCEIQSSSGEVLLFLNEKALGEINVAAKTLCGKIDYSGLKELSLRTWNTPYEMYVGTAQEFEKADVRIQTESGDIRIEKTIEASSNG